MLPHDIAFGGVARNENPGIGERMQSSLGLRFG